MEYFVNLLFANCDNRRTVAVNQWHETTLNGTVNGEFFFRQTITMRYFAVICRQRIATIYWHVFATRESAINRMSLIRGMFCATGWQTDYSVQSVLNRKFPRIKGHRLLHQERKYSFLPRTFKFCI